MNTGTVFQSGIYYGAFCVDRTINTGDDLLDLVG